MDHPTGITKLSKQATRRDFLAGTIRLSALGATDSNFDSSAPSSVEFGGIVVDEFSTLENGLGTKNPPSQRL